jgi:hypothetical protein
MDVYEAVTSRRAVRGFTDRQVPREVLERVLSAAAWSPSGSNLQPWCVYVLTGEPLAELKRRAGERAAAGDPWDEPERAEGLHSCAQLAWSVYHRTVAEVLCPPDGLVLYCGMSIGYEDVTVDDARTGRAPLGETVAFLGGAHTSPRKESREGAPHENRRHRHRPHRLPGGR